MEVQSGTPEQVNVHLGIGMGNPQLLLRKPSSLPRFEDLCKGDLSWVSGEDQETLQRKCVQAELALTSTEPPPRAFFLSSFWNTFRLIYRVNRRLMCISDRVFNIGCSLKLCKPRGSPLSQ